MRCVAVDAREIIVGGEESRFTFCSLLAIFGYPGRLSNGFSGVYSHEQCSDFGCHADWQSMAALISMVDESAMLFT